LYYILCLTAHSLFDDNFLSTISNVVDTHRDQASSNKETCADAVAGAIIVSLLEKFFLGASALQACHSGHAHANEKANGHHNWNGDDSTDHFSAATQASIGFHSRGFGRCIHDAECSLSGLVEIVFNFYECRVVLPTKQG
jgi:hypothetical protein